MLSNVLHSIFQHLSDHILMKILCKDQPIRSHAAFNELYRRYNQRIFFYIFNLTKQHQKSEELTNETFFTLYEKRHRFNLDKKLSPWLFTIARNKAFNILNKKVEILFSENDPGNITANNAIEDQQLYEIIYREEQKLIQQALYSIPEKQRDAITLWLDDLSMQEISEIMEITPQAVKNLIHRAKQQLIKKLNKE